MENTKTSEAILKNTEFNRFGLISVIILVVGCMGGFAVGLGAVEAYWSLTLIVVPTMLTLALLLAVAPMKYIFGAAITATVIDLLFISFYLLT